MASLVNGVSPPQALPTTHSTTPNTRAHAHRRPLALPSTPRYGVQVPSHINDRVSFTELKSVRGNYFYPVAYFYKIGLGFCFSRTK